MRIGFLGDVSKEACSPGADGGGDVDSKTSSAPKTRFASLMAFVSMTHAKLLPCFPPVASPCGPLSSCSIIHPASCSVVPYVAARLARTCGLTLATKILPCMEPSLSPV